MYSLPIIINAIMSSTATIDDGKVLSATNPLSPLDEDSISHCALTNSAKLNYWIAYLQANYSISEVHIKEFQANIIRGAKVYVDSELCGELSDIKSDRDWRVVKCRNGPIKTKNGSYLRIQMLDKPLGLCGIELKGTYLGQDRDVIYENTRYDVEQVIYGIHDSHKEMRSALNETGSVID